MDPFTRTHLLTQIPSSRANPPMAEPQAKAYTLSVQRRETSGQGRWREIASWTVLTTETDQFGPLNCGLRENYRILITDLTPTERKKSLKESLNDIPDHPFEPTRDNSLGERKPHADPG